MATLKKWRDKIRFDNVVYLTRRSPNTPPRQRATDSRGAEETAVAPWPLATFASAFTPGAAGGTPCAPGPCLLVDRKGVPRKVASQGGLVMTS